MDFIKNWVFCICITIIVSVIFSLVSPKGSMGRFYKIIISLFIFISFIFPFADFDIDEFKVDFNLESEYKNTAESTAEIEVEQLVKNELEKNGIRNASVLCNVTLQNDEFYIDYVKIYVSKDYNCDEVKDIIYNTLGIISEVECSGG